MSTAQTPQKAILKIHNSISCRCQMAMFLMRTIYTGEYFTRILAPYFTPPTWKNLTVMRYESVEILIFMLLLAVTKGKT